MTGAGTAAERGFTDVGLLTMSEMVSNARYIATAVDIPVVCDADTGYGNPLNVRRTVREYEAAGVAGIHIEDQLFPKKCGFFEGKQVIPLEEHVQKHGVAFSDEGDVPSIPKADHQWLNGFPPYPRRGGGGFAGKVEAKDLLPSGIQQVPYYIEGVAGT